MGKLWVFQPKLWVFQISTKLWVFQPKLWEFQPNFVYFNPTLEAHEPGPPLWSLTSDAGASYPEPGRPGGCRRIPGSPWLAGPWDSFETTHRACHFLRSRTPGRRSSGRKLGYVFQAGKGKRRKHRRRKKIDPESATKLATNSGASIWGKGAMRKNFGAFTESLPFLKKKEACRKPHPSQKRWGWVEWFAPSLVLGNLDPPAKRMSVSSFNCPICPEFDTTKENPTLVCMWNALCHLEGATILEQSFGFGEHPLRICPLDRVDMNRLEQRRLHQNGNGSW